MSFSSPAWLLTLLLIPVAALAYLYAQRRPKRYEVRFTALDTLRIAAGTPRAVWQRHLPAVLALLAVAALAIALAKPRTTYSIPIGQTSVMLVTDHSGSMAATDVAPNRLAAAEKAANSFIDKLPGDVKVGAVAFSTTADAVQGPVTNHDDARQIIDDQQANGATATGPALQLALQLLHGGDPRHAPSAMVLLSDGAANLGIDPDVVAAQARRDRIPIYTVALGTPNGAVSTGPFSPPQSVPPDPQLMTQIARTSGGRSFTARSANELSSIYSHLGDKFGSIKRKREITLDFAIAGLVLLLGAAGTATRWSGRLP